MLCLRVRGCVDGGFPSSDALVLGGERGRGGAGRIVVLWTIRRARSRSAGCLLCWGGQRRECVLCSGGVGRALRGLGVSGDPDWAARSLAVKSRVSTSRLAGIRASGAGHHDEYGVTTAEAETMEVFIRSTCFTIKGVRVVRRITDRDLGFGCIYEGKPFPGTRIT